MLGGFPSGNDDIASGPWLNWFSQLRNRINAPPLCEAYSSSSFTAPTGVNPSKVTPVFTTLNVNVPFNNGTFTVPISGIYDVAYFVQFRHSGAAVAPAQLYAGFYKNGVALSTGQLESTVDSEHISNPMCINTRKAYLSLIKGDKLDLYMGTGTGDTALVYTMSISIKFVQ